MGTKRRGLSRRKLLAVAAGTLALSSCKKSSAPAQQQQAPPTGSNLTADELKLCTAACERVLPADEDAGATQLGVAEYIDKRLSKPTRRARQARERLRKGLTALNDWSVENHEKPFIALDAATQDIALASFAAESEEPGYAFLRQLIELTLEGALADPAHGGNRDRAGWKLTGFDAPCPNPSCH